MVAPEHYNGFSDGVTMTNKISFTKQFLTEISPPAIKSREYFYDAKVNGLSLQVTQKGTKSFQVYRKIDGIPVRVTLGRFPDMTIDQARRMAMKKLSDMAEGINPNTEKKKQKAQEKESKDQSITLSEVFEDYLRVRKNLAANTVSGYKTLINKYLYSWLSKPLDNINRGMIAKKHEEISKHSETSANKTMRVVRALFNFANGQYEDASGQTLFPDNPVSRLSHTRAWNKEKRRQSVIERSQLKPWYEAVNSLSESGGSFDGVVRDYLLFVLFTGLRRREAAMLKWAYVNMEDKLFIVRETKNGTDLKLPYSDFVGKIISKRLLHKNSDYVFSGGHDNAYINDPRKQILKVREQSDVYFTIHDLRRTFITIAESLDISTMALKMLVNHSLGNDVTSGYVIMDVERLRSPVELISKSIEKCF